MRRERGNIRSIGSLPRAPIPCLSRTLESALGELHFVLRGFQVSRKYGIVQAGGERRRRGGGKWGFDLIVGEARIIYFILFFAK